MQSPRRKRLPSRASAAHDDNGVSSRWAIRCGYSHMQRVVHPHNVRTASVAPSRLARRRRTDRTATAAVRPLRSGTTCRRCVRVQPSAGMRRVRRARCTVEKRVGVARKRIPTLFLTSSIFTSRFSISRQSGSKVVPKRNPSRRPRCAYAQRARDTALL